MAYGCTLRLGLLAEDVPSEADSDVPLGVTLYYILNQAASFNLNQHCLVSNHSEVLKAALGLDCNARATLPRN